MQCNVNLRKLLSAHKSHVRETSLFTSAIPNPVRNSQTSRFVSVPGHNPGRSSRGDSVVLQLRSVMMADMWWCRSGTGIGYLKEFCFQSWVECSRGECERRIGEIKRWVRRMCKLTEVFRESVPKSWCSVGKGAVAVLPLQRKKLCTTLGIWGG